MAIDTGLLMAGLNLSHVSVVMAGTVSGEPPFLTIVTDGSTTFERLAQHQYRNGQPVDRVFDEIGKDMSVAIETPAEDHLSAVSNLRLRASLAKANASLLLPTTVLQHDSVLQATVRSTQGTGRYVYLYGPGITLDQAEDLLGVRVGSRFTGRRTLYSVIGVAVGKRRSPVRLAPATHLDPDLLREEALRWVITWETAAWKDSR